MVLVLIVKFLIFTAFCDAMTMKQIKSTGKMIRKTCQPKNNVNDEKIDPIANGEFIPEKEVMCYMACVMKMAGTCPERLRVAFDFRGIPSSDPDLVIMESPQEYTKKDTTNGLNVKNGKLNYDAAVKQADLLLPEELKEPAKAAITACKKVPDAYKDICEAAFHVTKCVYNHNPSIFYFP